MMTQRKNNRRSTPGIRIASRISLMNCGDWIRSSSDILRHTVRSVWLHRVWRLRKGCISRMTKWMRSWTRKTPMTRSHAPWPADHLETTIAANISASANRAFSCRCPTWHSSLLCPRSRCKPSSCVWLRNCDASTIRSMRTSRMTLPAKGPASISSWTSSVRPKPNGGAPAPRCSPTRRRCFAMAFSTRSEDPRSPSGSSGLAQFLQLDQRLLHYLLEHDAA